MNNRRNVLRGFNFTHAEIDFRGFYFFLCSSDQSDDETQGCKKASNSSSFSRFLQLLFSPSLPACAIIQLPYRGFILLV